VLALVMGVLVLFTGARAQQDQSNEIKQQAHELVILTQQRSLDRTSQIKFVCDEVNGVIDHIVTALRTVEAQQGIEGEHQIEAIVTADFAPIDCSKITTPK